MDDETPPQPPRQFTFKDKEFPRANLAATPPAPSVHEILRDNLAVQKSAEPELIPNLRDRRTKRRKDYWTLMIGINGLAFGVGAILGWNVISSVYLLAFLVMFNLGLPWIMFQIMDKY